MQIDNGYDGAVTRMGNYRAWAVWYYNNDTEIDADFVLMARLVSIGVSID